MGAEDLEEKLKKRIALSSRLLYGTIGVSAMLFGLLLGAFFMEALDSELAAAAAQMRLFVLSNTENFENRDDVALKRAAGNLIRSPLVSHLAVFDPQGRVLVWATSTALGATGPANSDLAHLATIQNKAKLLMATSGSDLVPMKLPSGKKIYRAYTPLTAKKGTVKLGEVEMGFFKSEVIARTLRQLRTPGAVAIACVLLLALIAAGVTKRWESKTSGALAEFVQHEMKKAEIEFSKKLAEQKRERDSKDVDGGSFFNIMEAVREISGAADLAAFVRRSVLSSVRLFRCRMVSFYVHDASNGAPWQLSGRYDGRTYVNETQESLDPSTHPRLKEALNVGATELLEGYPSGASQALLIAVSAERPLGALVLHNKVGAFDSKDLLAARIFAGFLPNLLAWHMK
ncbi:MAG: hypothetical protein A3G34_07515 [Candidatus Lindowbacteria bacterium RIFCSPLOWO2_12_FULL_62_27]|nr:MAG: hypothetical protein A3G34_07515 [Candidatus Lindowbacteria bacterium RIFCSPLOWO2_12_FULL_62_27]OGH62280.1 MAG: hypothetical protein A3I06_05010 [Candidatus Lindowbacteria bacterium RIFCSPLOWO2_02_FULL_62_12]